MPNATNPLRKRRRSSRPNQVLLQVNKGGRPTTYDPRYAIVAEHAQMCYGGTRAELAAFLDIEVTTLLAWAREHDEFNKAVNMSPELADLEVVAKLRHRAIGYTHESEEIFLIEETIVRVIDGEEVEVRTKVPLRVKTFKHYPPDTAAAIFWLKNRDPERWRDRVEHTGTDGAPITFTIDIGQARGETTTKVIEHQEQDAVE